MKIKVAIIGANLPSLSFYKQAKALGYEIHSFAWEEGAVCRKYADFFYPISIIEKEQICDICRKIGIDGIISFSLESALPTVNYVARELSLPGNTLECEILMHDKFSMREQLKKCGILVPEYYLIDTVKQLDSLQIKYPVIVKPVDSGGSRGVTLVRDANSLKDAFIRASEYSKSRRVLVEQYISGREFSIEYLSNRGEHYFLAITDKVTTGEPYFVELEHHQPAEISEIMYTQIKNVTEKTLNALKIFSSASHTEVKLDEKGDLYIIEVGGRMGGDMITSDLVKLSTGYDMVKGALEIATSKFRSPVFGDAHYSGIYFLSKERENLLKVVQNSLKYPEIIKTDYYGIPLKNIRESNDRAGYFIYQSSKKMVYEN